MKNASIDRNKSVTIHSRVHHFRSESTLCTNYMKLIRVTPPPTSKPKPDFSVPVQLINTSLNTHMNKTKDYSCNFEWLAEMICTSPSWLGFQDVHNLPSVNILAKQANFSCSHVFFPLTTAIIRQTLSLRKYSLKPKTNPSQNKTSKPPNTKHLWNVQSKHCKHKKHYKQRAGWRPFFFLLQAIKLSMSQHSLKC